MKFLRRSAPVAVGAEAPDAPAQGPVEPIRTAGKGRPTPKRRDAEAKRRGPAPPPPRTQREAAKLAKANRPPKEDRRAAAAERRAGMASGDDRYLMPRDRGPVRAYVRDVVDSRPHLIGLFMPLAILVLFFTLLPIPAVQGYFTPFSIIALFVMIVEGVWLGIGVTRRARAKYPKEQIGALSIGWYAFTRASQVRRLRMPKPRVQRGAQV